MKPLKNWSLLLIVTVAMSFSCVKVEMPGIKQSVSVKSKSRWKSDKNDSTRLEIKTHYSVTVKESSN